MHPHLVKLKLKWKTLFGWFSNLKYKCMFWFQVPNFTILKNLVFQFGIPKSNLKSNSQIISLLGCLKEPFMDPPRCYIRMYLYHKTLVLLWY